MLRANLFAGQARNVGSDAGAVISEFQHQPTPETASLLAAMCLWCLVLRNRLGHLECECTALDVLTKLIETPSTPPGYFSWRSLGKSSPTAENEVGSKPGDTCFVGFLGISNDCEPVHLRQLNCISAPRAG
ncbi:hypothetical protein BAURA86_00591 [Brevibacterium aurantiacum]|uniref:Uncharacterized protein n=1 Tax=Brevibacterium aurantiacum TaxID=273384 RepID=A0A2H1IJ41_BREAU|nr:hypothetical protein BAURA86_00591 [Brevibacterium aurantiacum]